MAYRVLDSSRPCSQVTGPHGGIWRLTFRSSSTDDDVFLATRVARRGTALSTAQSVRVFDVTNPQRPFQRTCMGVDVWEHAYY
jgi:superoxide dismutase